ncbi:MAG: Hsp20 family protein [Pseudohongiellaceae bacterium]
MSTETKYRLLLTFSILCLIGLVAQTIQVMKVNDRLAQIIPDSKERPSVAEQRLLAELGLKNRTPHRPSAMPSPFGSFNPIQDYLDSMFPGFQASAAPLFPRNFARSLTYAGVTPKIELDETDKEYRIFIPVDPEKEIELNADIEDNSVSVSGVITEKVQQKQDNLATSILSRSQFAKTVKLPQPIDEFGMTTEQTDAGIEITIPKKTG